VTSRLARARDAIKNALEDGGVATPRKRSDQ
jgi:hypothetical protein